MDISSGFDPLFASLNASFYAGMGYLTPYCVTLLNLFFAYQMVWGMVKNPTEMPFMRIALDTIRYGVILYILQNYKVLMDQLRDTFIRFGSIAAGSPSGNLTINDIFDKIINEIGDPLYEFIDSLSFWNSVGTILIAGVALILILLMLIVLCVYIFLTKLEFVVVSVLGMVFLPFYMFEKTSFIGEVWFKMMINNAIRLMVLSFLVFLTVKQMGVVSIEMEIPDIFMLLGSFSAIIILIYKVPSLMSSVISGSPAIGQAGTVSQLSKGAAKSGGKAAGRKISSAAAKIKEMAAGATPAAIAAKMMKK